MPLARQTRTVILQRHVSCAALAIIPPLDNYSVMHALLVLLIWTPTLRQPASRVPQVVFLFPVPHFAVLAQLVLQMKTAIRRQPAVVVHREDSHTRPLQPVLIACLVELIMIMIRLQLADFARLVCLARVEQHGVLLAQLDLLRTL